jgi:hypothetical protein
MVWRRETENGPDLLSRTKQIRYDLDAGQKRPSLLFYRTFSTFLVSRSIQNLWARPQCRHLMLWERFNCNSIPNAIKVLPCRWKMISPQCSHLTFVMWPLLFT